MKKSHGFALTLWSAFAAIFLLALLTFIQDGSRYIGKSYIDLDEFQRGLDDFYQTLGSTVLNPINIEAEKKRISVSKAEIEEHRNRYGTLSEQIENIEMQYEGRIADAEAGNSERLKDALVKERDSKIEDIRQNFEDDAHVEAKVRAEKEAQLESYLRDYINNLKSQSTLPAAYELKDVDTGEVFSSGDINAPAVYEQNFNVENGYFKAESIRDSDLGYHGFDDMYGEHAPRVQVETESPFKEETATSASDAATAPQS